MSKIINLEVPKGWVRSRIGEYTSRVQYGISKKMNTELKGVPILRMNNLDGEGFLGLSDLKYVDISSHDIEKYSLKKGDILFNRVNSVELVGKTSIVRELKLNLVFASYLIRVNVNSQKLLSEYLNYYMNSFLGKKEINRNLRRASGQANINAQELKLMNILVPSLQEQQKIVSILSNVDEIIQETQELIEQLQLIKKGLMQRFFTEGIGHIEFKETRLGRIPNKWKVVKIKEVGRVIGGGTPDTKNEDYWNGDIIWLIPTEITNLRGIYIKDSKRKISKLGFEKSGAKLIPKNSLILTSRASIGACAINTVEVTTNQGFQSIAPSDGLDVFFLYYLMQTYKMQNLLQRFATGSTFVEITNSNVKNLRIILPPLEEQKKIVEFLMNIDNKLFNEFDYKEKLQDIKRGLMQQLMTGKKRVPINEVGVM